MAVNKIIVGTEVKLDLTADTVSENNLLAGATAHNAAGEPIEGAVVTVPVDSELSETSENAIQNKAVAKAIKGGETLSGATGYTVTDSVEYPLIGMKLYGKSTQDGTPTPEKPVPIVSVENPKVNVCGKNLIGNTSGSVTICFPYEGIDFVKNSDGSITCSGIQTNYAYYLVAEDIKIDFKGKYIFSGTQERNGKHSLLLALTVSENQEAYVRLDSDSPNDVEVDLRQYPDLSKINVYIEIRMDDFNLTTPITFYPMLRPFGTDDTYEPYKSHTLTLPDTLNAIPVSSGGNVMIDGQEYIADYKDFGEGKCHRLVDPDKLDPTVSIVDNLDLLLENDEISPISETELQAYRQLQTYNGTTNISNDKGAGLSVKYCTNKALSECVVPIKTDMQKQIDELKAAISSLGGNV